MDLGVLINLYEQTDVPAAFREATEAGFGRGQVSSFVHGITAQEVRRVARCARDAGFQVDAVGCYINPLRLDDVSLHGVDGADWRTWAENMGMLGADKIVCWSGTLGRTLGAPTLLNGEAQTFNSLFIALSGLLEMARGLPLHILLEPYTAHVLGDAEACVRLARKFPGGDVRVVLDAPSLLPARRPPSGPRLAETVSRMVASLAPAVGLVHLKDFAPGADGLPRFFRAGAGSLDYGEYLRAIARFLPEVPVVIEQVRGAAEMRAAREFVQKTLKECAL